MPLINVRLDPEDARKAAALRQAGVAVSSVVREAIRAEYARVVDRRPERNPSEALARIYREIPDEDPTGEVVDTRDRRAIRAHVVERVERRRRGR